MSSEILKAGGNLDKVDAKPHMPTMTAAELHETIIAKLAKAGGGGRAGWRRAVGSVRVYSVGTHPHCNWDVFPSGTPGEIRAIHDVIDLMRDQHPVLEPD